MKIEIANAKDVQKKSVARLNNSAGRVYLPRKWVGKSVMVILLEE